MHALVISVVRCEVSLQTNFSSSFPHRAVTTILMFNILGSLVMSETWQAHSQHQTGSSSNNAEIAVGLCVTLKKKNNSSSLFL